MDQKPARARAEGGADGTERVRRGCILIAVTITFLMFQFVLFVVASVVNPYFFRG